MGQLFTFLRLARDDSLKDYEDVLDWILPDQKLADGVGELIEAAAVEELQVADFLQDLDEFIGDFVLVSHVGEQVVELGFDVRVKLVPVLH